MKKALMELNTCISLNEQKPNSKTTKALLFLKRTYIAKQNDKEHLHDILQYKILQYKMC